MKRPLERAEEKRCTRCGAPGTAVELIWLCRRTRNNPLGWVAQPVCADEISCVKRQALNLRPPLELGSVRRRYYDRARTRRRLQRARDRAAA